MKKIFVCLLFIYAQILVGNDRIIEVSGHSSVEIQTTLADIRLGIELDGKSSSKLQSDLADRANRVYQFLRQKEVQNLQTSQYTLTPQHASQAPYEVVGYKGQSEVIFRVALEEVSKLLPEIFEIGVTRLNSIQLTASTEEIQKAREHALQQAAQNALKEARIVLKSLDLEQNQIEQILIGGSRPFPVYRSNVMLATKEAGPNLEGQQEVNAEVTLKISFKDHLD